MTVLGTRVTGAAAGHAGLALAVLTAATSGTAGTFASALTGQLPLAVQFVGGAFILGGVTMVRLDELRPSRAPAGPPRSPAQQPELAPSRAPGR